MADKEKFNVFPTRMSMQLMKARLKVAEAGYKLLKQKVDALRFRYREIAHEIIEIKYMLSRIMTEAAYLLAETKYVTGDIINYDILHRVSKARLKVRDRVENIAGVEIRVFECFEAGEDEFTLTGLAKGGEKIQQLKKVYALATDILVQQATLENAFKTLDEVIRSTNRRVNALDCRIKYKAPVCQNILKEPLKESANSSRKRNFSESNVSDEDVNSKRYKPGVITLSSNGNEEHFVEKKFRKEKRKKQIESPVDSDSIYITAVEKKKKQTESPINSDSIYITAVEKKKKQTESPINSDSIYITSVEKRKKEKELPLDPENVCSASVEKRKKEKELLLNSENVCSTSVEKRKKEKKKSLTSENVFSNSVEKGKKQTESSVNFENSHSILSEESPKKSQKMDKKKSSIVCDRTVTGINFCISDSFYSFNAECTPQKQNKNYKSSKTAHLKSEEVPLVTLSNGSSYKEELNSHQNESSKVITDINYEALNSKNESKPKRKRRKKRKMNPATNVTDGSEVINVSELFSEDVEENINRKHVLYLSPDKIQENNCSNDASEFLNPSTETFVLKEDKFANIRGLDYPKMSTPTQSNNCGVPDWQLSIMPSKNSSLVKYVESNENGSILHNKSTRSTASQSHRESKSEKQSYEHLPDITSLPIVGTYIAYKTLELNENYSPSVTDYREGVVERINPDTEELEIRLIKEIILPGKSGKFENLGKDEVPEDIVKSYDVLKWCDIISPKLLSCVPD